MTTLACKHTWQLPTHVFARYALHTVTVATSSYSVGEPVLKIHERVLSGPWGPSASHCRGHKGT